ncbi:MAG: WecB/TagA/CpsF family glycosyltransferase [Pontiellaceae bacterium]
MSEYLVNLSRRFIPAVGSIIVFFCIHVIQKIGGFMLPFWCVVVLSILWVALLLGYLLQFNIFKRIGGTLVCLLSIVIVVGTLLPQQTIQSYPEKTSQKVTEDFDVAWKSIYGKDLFEEFSLHRHLLQYAKSLTHFDVHRAGQVGLFSLFGMALGICFLFPVDPSERRSFIQRILLLLVVGLAWAFQTELLQVLSRTREVTFVGFIESFIGVSLGIFLFAVADVVYLNRKRSLEDRRFNILGVGIDAVNMTDCLELFEEVISYEPTAESRQQRSVSTPKGQTANVLELSSGLRTKLPAMTTAMGVAGIVESRRNQTLQRILNESVLNTPDGMPLVWLGKMAGYRAIDRVYGPDLLRDVCAYGEDKGWRHYFWGAAPGIVEKLKEVLEEKHPKIEISGICCPPFRSLTQEEEDQLVEEVNESNTDIFWIGISTPKQLYFMDRIRDRLHCKIICPVGYAFDVNAGVEKDAADWIKYSGFQWLHRAIKQPRLWKRYLPDNPTFILKVIFQLLRFRSFPMCVHERVSQPYKDEDGYDRFPVGCVSLSAQTMSQACERVESWIEQGKKKYVNICTADTVVQCYDQPALAKIVMNSGMATTDGMPLVWLARRFGFAFAERVYGPDLMLALCSLSESRGYRHFFYGATDEVLDRLKINLLAQFPALAIAGMYSPPFRPLEKQEKDEVVEKINASGADIIWCGLGTPKQDYWVSEFRPLLEGSVILAVGAGFNFHAGSVRQAPRWMMKSGLEWLFRLIVEPRRLWRRYLIGNPRFLFQTRKQWNSSSS